MEVAPDDTDSGQALLPVPAQVPRFVRLPEGGKASVAFTKAEARHIPNSRRGTTDMAHPTRTGDLVVFSSPPYQWDAATPGTLIAPSAFASDHAGRTAETRIPHASSPAAKST